MQPSQMNWYHPSQNKIVEVHPVTRTRRTNVRVVQTYSVDNAKLVCISVPRRQGQKGTDSRRVKASVELLVETEEIGWDLYRFKHIKKRRQTANG
mmetsp:Transcript_782/g.1644  ORF Transcript_782/g.1644 Transcript_782/m.1644 type:complete len:95 (-) Transcript_782:269-553(-)